METQIKFNACEHLDFSDNYTAKKEPIQDGGVTKVCWNRPVIDESFPKLVQFCKKRGRLNSPEICLCEQNKRCSDFKDFEHVVTLSAEGV